MGFYGEQLPQVFFGEKISRMPHGCTRTIFNVPDQGNRSLQVFPQGWQARGNRDRSLAYISSSIFFVLDFSFPFYTLHIFSLFSQCLHRHMISIFFHFNMLSWSTDDCRKAFSRINDISHTYHILTAELQTNHFPYWEPFGVKTEQVESLIHDH